MPFVSYSQNLEDVILWRALKSVKNGCYIDVGANDPDVDSVTRAFYERGWTGINIEPISMWHEKLVHARPNDLNLLLAAGSCEKEIKIYEVVDTGLSTSDYKTALSHNQNHGFDIHEHVVPVKTLTSIVKSFPEKEIHFLKVDVEGAEKDVLQGIDFKIVRPWVILVEATKPNSQEENYNEWEHLLLDQNYLFVYFDGLNRYYLAKEKENLRKSFSVQPNVFDNYVLAETVVLQESNNKLQERNNKLKDEIKRLNEIDKKYKDILNSRFWRFTTPIRKLLVFLKKKGL